MSDSLLTIESLRFGSALLRVLFPRIPVGMACSPHTKSIIDGQGLNPPGFGQIEMLIDPRLKVETSEVYYDRDLWDARCDEQRKWDAAPATDKSFSKPKPKNQSHESHHI